MTVATTATVVSYAGDASTTVFAYDFKVFDADHLKVLLRSNSGTETTLTRTTHYTVSSVGVGTGGNVTITDSDYVPGTTATIFVKRVPSLLQQTDLKDNDDFSEQTIEDSLDKRAMVELYLLEILNRTLTWPETYTGSGAIPEPQDGAVLGWSGTTLVNLTNVTGTVITAFMKTVLDDTAAANARTTLGAMGSSDVSSSIEAYLMESFLL